MKKRFFHFLPLNALVFAGIILALWQLYPTNRLKVVFCDVGQGDGIYMRFPNGTDMVIDGGPNNKILSCVGKYMPVLDRKIELVLMTHPQKDHMHGFIELFKRYKIDTLLTTPVGHTTESFIDLKKIIDEKNILLGYPFAGNKIKLGKAELDFFWPERDWLIEELHLAGEVPQFSLKPKTDMHPSIHSDEDLNLFSIYTLIRYGSFELLLTGDGDTGTQKFITELGLDKQIGDIEVLKFPHHGSKNAITEDFLFTLNPEAAILMVGKNSYGHPSEEVLKLLHAQNVHIYRTDQNGDVILTVSPTSWNIRPTKN